MPPKAIANNNSNNNNNNNNSSSSSSNSTVSSSLNSTDTDSSSINNINNTVCTTYVEELIADGLTRNDDCPSCPFIVARHARQPNINSNINNNNNNNNNNLVPVNPRPTSSSELLKIVSVIPKWSKGTSCRPFIQRLNNFLSPLSVSFPETEWPHVFAYIITDDLPSSNWINTNIIEKKLSWSDSCNAFTAHFQSADYLNAVQNLFDLCKQQSNETVQSYGDRFTDICTQLGITDDNDLARRHFINHLQPNLHRQFHATLASMRITKDDDNFNFTSLIKVIKTCISLDVSNRSANSNYDNSSSNNNRNQSTDRNKKIL